MNARRMTCLAGLALLLAAGARADGPRLEKSVTGTPELKTIDVIRFAPGGVLLLGDGKGSQVIALATDAKEGKAGFTEAVTGIKGKIGARLGAPEADVEIADIAVHPVSHVAFLAVRKKGDPRTALLTIDGAGKINEFSLEGVKHVRLQLPAGAKAPVTKVTDLAWAGDRLLVAGMTSEEFGSKILVVKDPLVHEAKASIHSAETYHVAHRKWETKAPMRVLMPFEEEGKKYLAGSFTCTPVVKYPLDELKDGDKVKGVSMLEMGSGNQPLNMFSYEKGGKSYVLMNTFRFHHSRKPVGPSPYWTVRFERALLTGSDKDKINEKAIWRIDGQFNPTTDRIKVAEDYHGVVHMDKLDDGRALTLKEDGKGGLTLIALALP